MGIMDFLFGSSDQTVMDPQIKRARDFLLDQMLMQYSAGPVNVPQYMAKAPSARYSGANALLSSLGLEGVEAPDMPTTSMNGMDVYTSGPLQQTMERRFEKAAPAQYDYLRSFYMDPVTGEFGERSYGYNRPMQQPVSSGGGGGSDDRREPSMSDEEVVMSQLGRGGFTIGDHLRAGGLGTPISFTDPASTGSFGGSLVTGRPSDSSQDIFAQANAGAANAAETSFGSDLSRSLSDPNYDPPGTVVSRALDRIGGWFGG